MKADGILKNASLPPERSQTAEKAAADPPLETPGISKPDRTRLEREKVIVLLQSGFSETVTE